MRTITRALALVFIAGCSQAKPQPAVTTKSPVPDGKVICSVVSRDRTLVILSTPDGPKYLLKDARGNVLMPASTLDEVYARNPQLYREIRRGMAADASVYQGASGRAPALRSEPISGSAQVFHAHD